MVRRSTPQKKTDDEAFPVRVKVRVPERGMGKLTDAYYAWLNDCLGACYYANHSTTTIGGDATAFYFRDIENARDFLAAFPQLELADGTLCPSYSSPVHDAAWSSGDKVTFAGSVLVLAHAFCGGDLAHNCIGDNGILS